MFKESNLRVHAIIMSLFVCFTCSIAVQPAVAANWPSASYTSPSKAVTMAAMAYKNWNALTTAQLIRTKISPVSYSSARFQPAGVSLKTYLTTVSPTTISSVNPSVSTSSAISSGAVTSGFVPAVMPRITIGTGGDWQYSEGIDAAIVSMVRSGSQDIVGQQISFSADGNTFAGTVMAVKPNEMAVKAENSAWFGLITTSSDGAITIITLGLTDEGTADLSSVEVLKNGAALRIAGTDPDGKPGTVEFDIVGGRTVSADPSLSELTGLVLASQGVVYELVSNESSGLNLLRINSISYENGSIVIND